MPAASLKSIGPALAACLFGGLALPAQDTATFSTGVNVVSVFPTVRDSQGQLVRDLKKEDFEVLENGRPQLIRYFLRETDLPLSIGLLVDTSMSQEKVLNAERGASLRFLDQVLRENKDQFLIMQFDLGMMLRQELTSSRSQLSEALAFVDTPTRSQLAMGAGRGGTVLYDAVVKAAGIMAAQKNRKALVVMSDGVDYGSDASLDDAVNAAQKAGAIVYSILFADPGYYGSSGEARRGENALKRLAQETGGRFFQVTKKLDIGQTFDLIQADLRSQYSLGYTPDPPVDEPQYRKLQVSVRQAGFTVDAPRRYYATP